MQEILNMLYDRANDDNNKDYQWYTSGCGRIELVLKTSQANYGYHSGRCDYEIAEMMTWPAIKAQLDKLNPSDVANVLSEFGCDWDLSNHKVNLERLLWTACGDVVENLDEVA